MILEFNPQIKEFLNVVDLVSDKNKKLTFLEMAIDLYKSQRDKKTLLTEENETLAKEILETKERMRKADGLVQVYQRLLLEDKKFGKLSKDKSLDQKVLQIKNKRISNIFSLLTKLGGTLSTKVNEYLEKNSRGHLKAKSILLVTILLVPASIFIYLLSSDSQIIYVGGTVILINLFIFFLINIFSDPSQKAPKDNSLGLDYNKVNKGTYEQLISKLNQRSEDSFLVNAAWVDALRAEAKRVYIAISQSLDGQNYNEVKRSLEATEEKIRQNDLEINSILDSLISAEEYLKLRREVDILKIETDTETPKDPDNVSTPNFDNEIIIKDMEIVGNPLKNYLKKFFEYIDKRYIIKYV